MRLYTFIIPQMWITKKKNDHSNKNGNWRIPRSRIKEDMLVPDVNVVVIAHKIGYNLPRGQNKPDKLHNSYL